MPQTNISKIGKIAGLGLFKECRAADNPDFRQYNLVYGFNGSGKTTLSRIFASLGLGARSTNLPEEGSFDVHLSDGTNASSDGDLSALRGRVLVFNTDFIEESFQWKKGEARPVFYIGKEQAELAEQLAKAVEAVGKAEPEARALQEQVAAAERSFSIYKRNLARQITEQLGLGRKYDASHLAADYATPPDGGYKPLSDDEQTKARAMLAQAQPLSKLGPVVQWNGELGAFVRRCSEKVSVSIGELAIEDLRGHDEMRDWLGKGLKYHDAHSLKNCLLCGNELSKSRRADLARLIDSTYETLMSDLKALRSDLLTAERRYQSADSQYPRAAEFGQARQSAASRLLFVAKGAAGEGVQVLITCPNYDFI